MLQASSLPASFKKKKVNRVRATIGGDTLDYEGFASTVPATFSTFTIHLKSVVSTPKSKHMILDIKYFYYGTPMKDFEYGHMPLEIIPDEIIKQCNLLKIAVNEKAYF